MAAVIKLTGLAVLIHAAFAFVQYRSSSPSSTPILSPSPEILLEVVAGFLISLFGTIYGVPPLGIVRGNSHKKQNPNFVGPPPSYRTRDFDVFNIRHAPR
ncbi:hypothetical protein TrVE_jg796 [Triparma verrucosa]|uniref:Membrane magnesium transporter n=2 Tax=Triparma TaxID=722752 RepID=A0A9W7AI90_9STRA|nr:hypothetical protein TrST_g2397 [Triparma strigata]GMH95243.1 hypothetical protein TrVE_jg796 [Triparma verrucosa]